MKIKKIISLSLSLLFILLYAIPSIAMENDYDQLEIQSRLIQFDELKKKYEFDFVPSANFDPMVDLAPEKLANLEEMLEAFHKPVIIPPIDQREILRMADVAQSSNTWYYTSYKENFSFSFGVAWRNFAWRYKVTENANGTQYVQAEMVDAWLSGLTSSSATFRYGTVQITGNNTRLVQLNPTANVTISVLGWGPIPGGIFTMNDYWVCQTLMYIV